MKCSSLLREQITINNGLVQQVAETLELQALTDGQMAAREAAGKAIPDRKVGVYASDCIHLCTCRGDSGCRRELESHPSHA